MTILFGLSCGSAIPVDEKPLARKGLIDFSRRQLDQGVPLELSGEWEVFRNRLLVPSDFETPLTGQEYIYMPRLWNGYVYKGKTLEGYGFATFRLRVRLSEAKEDGLYAVKIPLIQTAFSLWIDRKAVLSGGKTGRNKGESRPGYHPSLVFFQPRSGEFEILLQISNFHYGEGGLPNAIMFGSAAEMKAHWKRQIGVELFLLGSIFIMGVYHFGLFINRKKDQTSRVFALFCFLMFLATSFSGEHLFYLVFTGIDLVAAAKMNYIVNQLSAVIFLVYLRAFFPGEFSKKIAVTFYTILTFLSLFILFIPMSIFTIIRNIFYIALIFIFVYIVYGIIMTLVRKREGSLWFFSCMFIFLGTVVNDILYDLAIVRTGYLMKIGLFIFFLSQSFILATRLTKTFLSNKTAAESLKKTNASLSRLDRLKEAFLSKISSELQIPLTHITAIIEKITGNSRENLSLATIENLELITLSVRRLSQLVGDMEDSSALRKGSLYLLKKPVDMYTVTSSVMRMMKVLVEGKGLEFINAILPGRCYVYGDEDRLRQIMFNLINNAVKFTSWGYVLVYMEKKEGFFQISVQDTGDGIPPEKQSDIFSPSKETYDTIFKQYGGTGYGLYITKQLVALHEGTIGIKSVPGEGSLFSFTLPALAGDISVGGGESAAPESVTDCKAVRPVLREIPGMEKEEFHVPLLIGKKVLVVDDNPVNLKVIVNTLTLEGVESRTASSGNEAVKILKEDSAFNLIILDVFMPGINGFETCRIIREELNFKMEHLPVILVTSKTGMNILARGFKVGANDFIIKPFYREELWTRLRFHLHFCDITRELEGLTSKLGHKLDDDIKKLDAKNHEVLDSIQYSRYILSAVQPRPELFERCFREHFIYRKSGDMVGGSFQWAYDRKNGGVLMGIIDCPGTGVPGTFVALLVNSLLNRICEHFVDDDPSEILFFLNWKLRYSFSCGVLDFLYLYGLDVSICYVNPEERRVIFAGTGHSLYFKKAGLIFEIPGEKQSLGRKDSSLEENYPNHTVTLEGEESFYLQAGGFFEQNESTSGSSPGKSMIKEWLTMAAGKSMEEQEQILQEQFNLYKSGEKQGDDITLIGFRV